MKKVILLGLFCIGATYNSFVLLPAPVYAGEFLSSPACTSPGVIGCRAYDSVEDVIEGNTKAVPNTPNNPLTNIKCGWNGGDRDCYPFFDGGDSSVLDSLGQRSQDNVETAKLWSPSYDTNANGARMTFWNDLGSSVQLLPVISDINQDFAQIWTQYEIMLSPEFFFHPEGTTSAKLYRIEREKSDDNRDKRFADHRFFKISPEKVTIGPYVYGAGVTAAGGPTQFDIDPSRANHWIRITSHYDITNASIDFWGYDATTGELLSHKFANSRDGVPYEFSDPTQSLRSFSFTHHSSSHQPNSEKPSPHYWLRNAVLSKEAITPIPEPSTLGLAGILMVIGLGSCLTRAD